MRGCGISSMSSKRKAFRVLQRLRHDEGAITSAATRPADKCAASRVSETWCSNSLRRVRAYSESFSASFSCLSVNSGAAASAQASPHSRSLHLSGITSRRASWPRCRFNSVDPFAAFAPKSAMTRDRRKSLANRRKIFFALPSRSILLATMHHGRFDKSRIVKIDLAPQTLQVLDRMSPFASRRYRPRKANNGSA